MSVTHDLIVLMADDDEDDCMLAEQAWLDARVKNELRFVHDGQELMEYLRHTGKYKDPASAPRPGLILLDLNMPRMDGREAAAEIKGDPKLRHIPLVVLTTSKVEEDIIRSYELGVNSFITKPVHFPGLLKVVRSLENYWLNIVELPPPG